MHMSAPRRVRDTRDTFDSRIGIGGFLSLEVQSFQVQLGTKQRVPARHSRSDALPRGRVPACPCLANLRIRPGVDLVLCVVVAFVDIDCLVSLQNEFDRPASVGFTLGATGGKTDA